ncbi:MAG TPA: hypothetical protein ENH85_09775 [Candidatus Scalindua sp.]|nr:hypothetical protein [Candidatus Scalindua sp.]
MKRHAGQPTKFTSINLAEVTHYAQSGYTDEELARIFDVTRTTIGNWKNSYPEFFDTLKSGKLIADSKVEASLYQRACGYSHPEIHISNYQGRITKTHIIKHYPPDPVSMIFWLKNRKPKDWREKTPDEKSHITNIIYNVVSDKLLSKRDKEVMNANRGQYSKS